MAESGIYEKQRHNMRIIVVHDKYSNEPIIINTSAINAIRKAFDETDENNMFVVGDVKQSIYGFRQAKPEIFINRRKSYKRFDRENADKRHERNIFIFFSCFSIICIASNVKK